MHYRREQERVKSDITKAVTVASPPRLKWIKASIPTPPNTDISIFTPDEGLALYLDHGLSKEKYGILRGALKRPKFHIRPSYTKIGLAKKRTVQPKVEVTNTSVKVKLQDLMDHTACRIIESMPEDTVKLLPDNLTLMSKWGCDGSSGQNIYKQKIVTKNGETISYANMFMASVVP